MGLSADDYRAEVAKIIHEAAATHVIPARFQLSSRGPVTDLAQQADCCFLVDHLVRSNVGRRWGYVGPLPATGSHPSYGGLQPEIGDVIAELRELTLAERRQEVAERKLAALRQRAASIRAAREVLDAMWVEPIKAVHAAGDAAATGSAVSKDCGDD